MKHPYLSFISSTSPGLESIQISELSPGLNVIYGSNEAGKSRTKDFIEWIMYANASEYENATKGARSKAFEHLPNNLNGRYRLHVNQKDISINLKLENGESIVNCESNDFSASDISHILNDGISREHFRHVFSLSLDELNAIQSDRLMNEDQLREEFLSASQTLSGVSYSRFVSTLRDMKDNYFSESSNAKKPIINKLLKEIKSVEAEIAELKKRDSSLGSIENEIAEKTEQANKIKTEIELLRESLAKVKETQLNQDNYEEYLNLLNQPEVTIHPVLASKYREIEALEDRCESLIENETQLAKLNQEINELETIVNERYKTLNLTLDPDQITDYVLSAEFISATSKHEKLINESYAEIKRLQNDNHKYSQEIELTIKKANAISSGNSQDRDANEIASFYEDTSFDTKENKSKTRALLSLGIATGIALCGFGALGSLLPIAIVGALIAGVSIALLFSESRQNTSTHPEASSGNEIDNQELLNNAASEHQLTIDDYGQRIEKILENIMELEKNISTANHDFDLSLSKAGFSPGTSHDLLDPYLAQYNAYIADKEKLDIKKSHQASLKNDIEKALVKIESLRPLAAGTQFALTSPLETISESLSWIKSLGEFSLQQQNLETTELERDSRTQQLEKSLTQAFSSIEKANQIYSSTSKEQLSFEVNNIQNEISSLENIHSNIKEEIGAQGQVIKDLKASTDITDAMLRKSQLQDELSDAHKNFTIISKALSVADEAAQYFLRENQPTVLNHASSLLKRATNSKWSNVEIGFIENSKSSTPIINVSNEDKTITLNATQLSRGAQEQLFLCLRLAVMETYIKGKHIPVLFDDIAVNADRSRFEALAPLIGEIAQNRQVFYFTCHETTRDILKNKANASVFEI